MEELGLFFDALRSGGECPVEVVREALARKRAIFEALQGEAMLDEDECARRLAVLATLAKMCDKLDLLGDGSRRLHKNRFK